MTNVTFGNIGMPFDDQYKMLNYSNENFNNQTDLAKWLALGFANKFTGDLCDMRNPQPTWNTDIVTYFENLGWKDIGTSYYRMTPGTILPVHSDTYAKYIEIFSLQGKEESIRRAVIFPEDWASGHYAEYNSEPFVKWQAGDFVIWNYNLPHMAANNGITPRYTIQVTGHAE
jgi:hypothetical protein